MFKNKYKKKRNGGFNGFLMILLAILTLIGGLVHIGESYNIFNLLSIFGGIANLIQFIAGSATVIFSGWFLIWYLSKRRK